MDDPPNHAPRSRPPFTVVDGGARAPDPPPLTQPPPPLLASGTDTRTSPRHNARELTELFEKYNHYVLKRLFRYGVRNAADLEEQAMRVWEVVIERYDEFRHEAAVTTWLSEICRRVASDFRRAAWQRRASLAPDGTPPEPEASDAELEQVVAVIDALALLSKLPPNLRDVLVLYYVEDRTAREIADSLGLPSGRAVYTLIDNALRRLTK